MNKNSFEAQLTANFVASQIRQSGINQAARLQHLREVLNSDSFSAADLAEVLDSNWKSPEQIQAEKEAA
jgi:Tfp pilus assembly protein PilW